MQRLNPQVPAQSGASPEGQPANKNVKAGATAVQSVNFANVYALRHADKDLGRLMFCPVKEHGPIADERCKFTWKISTTSPLVKVPPSITSSPEDFSPAPVLADTLEFVSVTRPHELVMEGEETPLDVNGRCKKLISVFNGQELDVLENQKDEFAAVVALLKSEGMIPEDADVKLPADLEQLGDTAAGIAAQLHDQENIKQIFSMGGCFLKVANDVLRSGQPSRVFNFIDPLSVVPRDLAVQDLEEITFTSYGQRIETLKNESGETTGVVQKDPPDDEDPCHTEFRFMLSDDKKTWSSIEFVKRGRETFVATAMDQGEAQS